MSPVRASASLLKAVGLSQPKGWHPNKKRIPSNTTKIKIAAKGRDK